MPRPPAPDLVGRDRLLAGLVALVDRAAAGERATALVAGEAGIGKTTLLRAVAAHAASVGARTAWGTGLDADGAPGFWPWTQVLRDLEPALAPGQRDDRSLGAPIVGQESGAPGGEPSERDRLLAMDATRRLLEGAAADTALLVVLDDLQWADPSTLALFELVARSPAPARLCLLGAFRDDEAGVPVRRRLAALGASASHFTVGGLDVDAVRAIAERAGGTPVSAEEAAAIHRRTGGHPFFVRELALIGGRRPAAERLPAAVRDAVERRVGLLPGDTVAVLEVAALGGLTVVPDVAAAALGTTPAAVEAAMGPAIEAGVVVRSKGDGAGEGENRLAHDLLREVLAARVTGRRRRELHRAIGVALEQRAGRGAVVPPSELARHFVAAVALDGPDRAVRWSLAAAAADRAALAFAEAAAHLRRLRHALAEVPSPEIDPSPDIGTSPGDERRPPSAPPGRLGEEAIVEVLLVEADCLARAGATTDARGLLRHAAEVAGRCAHPAPAARVALATAQLGARFAARRDETIRLLDDARQAVAGRDDALEARLTATLARELQHSVAEDRPRAAPLSEQALGLGRRSADADTLLDCLLARHDVLWEPGGGPARAEVAREIVEVAIGAGDDDRRAEGLLLLANALLEQGSPAFEGPLEEALGMLDARGQPRHRYTALTRRACVALLRGALDEAERLVDEAKVLGDQLLEPDAGNVHMSQRLELVRARAEPAELAAFASAAVAHWTGAPIHAHAVAAGFLARAGELEAADRHVAAVLDLGSWRADRSYLWSVFVRELAVAAVALGHRRLCAELVEDLRPLARSCGVNGAVVAFAGSHAHPAALVAAALGDDEAARDLSALAAATHHRLGAPLWPDAPGPDPARAAAGATASLRRQGSTWEVTFGGRAASVAHVKGLVDIARLVGAGGAEVHVLDLFEATVGAAPAGEVADRRSLAAYRERLAALDAEIDEAAHHHDGERRARAELERQAIVDELGRVAGAGGRPRQFANHPAERARKAVTARIRDAIRRLEPALPDLAAHLERSIVTGTYCRYRADGVEWRVDAAGSR